MSTPEHRPDVDCPPATAVTTIGQLGVVSDGPLSMSVRGITLSSHLERRRDSGHSLPLLTVGAQCMLSFSRPSLGLRRTLEGPRRSRLHSCQKMRLQLPRIDEEHVIAEHGTSVRQSDLRCDPTHVTGNGHLTTRFLTPVPFSSVAMTPVVMTPVAGTQVALATGSSGVQDRVSMDRIQRRLESLRPDQSPRFRTVLRPITGSDSPPDVTQNGLMTSSTSLPVVNLNRSTDALQDVGPTSVTASLPVPLWRRSMTLTRAEVDDLSSQQHGTSVADRKSQFKRIHCADRPRLPLPVPLNGFSRHPIALSRGRHPGRSLGTSRSYGLHGSLSIRSHVSTSFNFDD